MKKHLAKQLPLDHGHPDVWCPFGREASAGAYDATKHIIVFELWQADCDDCIVAREKARGSYSFAEDAPTISVRTAASEIEKFYLLAKDWHEYALKIIGMIDGSCAKEVQDVINQQPPWEGP